jgi:hypothetical protein
MKNKSNLAFNLSTSIALAKDDYNDLNMGCEM